VSHVASFPVFAKFIFFPGFLEFHRYCKFPPFHSENASTNTSCFTEQQTARTTKISYLTHWSTFRVRRAGMRPRCWLLRAPSQRRTSRTGRRTSPPQHSKTASARHSPARPEQFVTILTPTSSPTRHKSASSHNLTSWSTSRAHRADRRWSWRILPTSIQRHNHQVATKRPKPPEPSADTAHAALPFTPRDALIDRNAGMPFRLIAHPLHISIARLHTEDK
jgi:hypothetical protein